MNLSNLSIFGLASDRMSWLSARQRVTSENVANASTPNYQSKDITDFATLLDAQSAPATGLAATHPKHITGTAGPAPDIREVPDPAAHSTRLDGNTVNLEDQAIRSAEISDQYRLAAQLYRKGYELLTLSVTGR